MPKLTKISNGFLCLTFSTFKYHYLGTKYELRVQLLDQNEQILRQQVISKSVQPFEPKVSVLIFTSPIHLPYLNECYL